MIEFIQQPWPWYVAGPIIALVYFVLLYFGKNFGISAGLRTMCSAMGAGKKIEFFDFDWKGQTWNLVFILGAVIGGYIANTYLSSGVPIGISEATIANVESYGLTSYKDSLAPTELFNWADLLTLKGFLIMIVGGFLVGFGSRYAGGCTSGHAISGLADLQLPSLVAVIGFFIGGLIVTWFVLPYVLTL